MATTKSTKQGARPGTYRDLCMRLFKIMTGLVIALICSIVVNVVQALRGAPPPEVYAADTEGRVIKLESVSLPLSNNAIQTFAVDAIPKLFTASAAHFDEDVEANRLLFTDRGFELFKNALATGGLRAQVVDNRVMMTSQLISIDDISPIDDLVPGRKSWKVTARTTRTYTTSNKKPSFIVPVTLYVVRMSSLERPRQLAILRAETGDAQPIPGTE